MTERPRPTEDELDKTDDPVLLLQDIRRSLNAIFGLLFVLLLLTAAGVLRFWFHR